MNENWRYNIFWVLVYLLPLNSTFQLALLPLLMVFFLKKHSQISKNNTSLILLFASTLVISLFLNNNSIESKSFIRITTLIFLIASISFVKISPPSSLAILMISIIIFISQISVFTGLSQVTAIVDRFYPINEFTNSAFTSDSLKSSYDSGAQILSRRLGGLYRNPNQTAKYYTSLLTFLLLINTKQRLKLFNILLIILGVLITGSRTGIVIALLITFLILRKNQTKYLKTISGVLIFGLFTFQASIGEIRSLNILAGLNDSLNQKIVWLIDAFNNLSITQIFFGVLDSVGYLSQSGVTMLDSEIGESLIRIGLIGTLCYLIFLIYSILIAEKYSQYAIFLLSLWGFTSTLIFSYRFSFIYLLIIAMISKNYASKNT